MLPKAKKDWTIEEAAHLARRAGFGASPAELAEIHAMGREAAVDRLLDMARTAVNVWGDSCAAVTIARSEGETLFERPAA